MVDLQHAYRYVIWASNTVDVEIFAQYIFSRRAIVAQKFDVSENYNHNRTIRINWWVRENIAAGVCFVGLDARKYSSAKISTFTVNDCSWIQ